MRPNYKTSLITAVSLAALAACQPSSQAAELAKKEEVEIRLYTVIYDVVNDIRGAMVVAAGLIEGVTFFALIVTIVLAIK